MKLLIAFWFIAISLPLTYYMGLHSAVLNPSKDKSLVDLVNSNSSSFKILHILGTNCVCSENVYQALVKRKALSQYLEKVIIIGERDEWKKNLTQLGYEVEYKDSKEMAKKYFINATPQLTVFNQDNNMIYGGGYTNSRNIASEIEDLTIIKKIINNKQNELPVYGCLSETL